MMKCYKFFRDSGIKWFGKIPEKWEVAPLISLYRISKGLPITKANLINNGIPVINYGQIHSKDNICSSIKREMIRYVEPSYLKTNINSFSNKGDILLADTSEDIDGSGAFVYVDDEEGVFAGYHTLRLHPIDGKERPYLGYLFQSPNWRAQIQSLVSGVKLYSITNSILRTVWIILPSEREQQAICNYLDIKTRSIDNVIQKQVVSIRKLQELKITLMQDTVTKGLKQTSNQKDSNIQWIGKIPGHWQVGKLLHHARLESGHTPSKQHPEWWVESECTIPWLTTSDIHRFRHGEISEIEDTEEHISQVGMEHSSARLLPEGTVALSRTASVGFSVILGREMATSQDFANWIPDESLDSRYLLYALRSMTQVLDKLKMGTTHKTIYMPDIRKLVIPFPPLAEQREIADYLDKVTKQIDEIINTKRELVDKLQEYRKSLIYEAVTGKIKVPEVGVESK